MRCSHSCSATHAAIRQIQPALVLLDVGLGDAIHGWTLLPALRADPATAHLPCLLGTLDPSSVAEHPAAGPSEAAPLLSLPLQISALVPTVQALVGPSTGDGAPA